MRTGLLVLCLLGGLAAPAWAQQPTALPAAPTVPPAPAASERLAELPPAEVIGHPGEVIGQTYSVETAGGTQFSGTLQAATEQTLTFETRELGVVTLQRASLRQLMAQTTEQVRRGFDYVGNGTRLLLAPTARNLHQGEGYVQAIKVFLLTGNFGITDNISVGLLVPVIPFVGVPFLAVTPKVSVPVTDRLHLGAGVFYGFGTSSYSSGSAGAGFGLATYGTADANVTFGLGYGFSSDGGSSSPVGMLGANVRISRLFSLVNETYLANFSSADGVVGLAGLRYASPRFSGSLGALYYAGHHDGGIYPAYLDVAYRFGKIKLR